MTTRPSTPHRATRGGGVRRARSHGSARGLRRREGPAAPRIDSLTVAAPRRSPASQGRHVGLRLGNCRGPWQQRRGTSEWLPRVASWPVGYRGAASARAPRRYAVDEPLLAGRRRRCARGRPTRILDTVQALIYELGEAL